MVAVSTAQSRPRPRARPSEYQPGPSLADVRNGAALQRGHSGEAVKELQRRLNAAGANPPLAVDGKLGPLTEGALKGFQAKSGLPETGRLDAAGLTKIEEVKPSTVGAEDTVTRGSDPWGPKRAPRAGEPPPAGTIQAGALAQADSVRKLPSKGGANEIQLDVPFYSQFDEKHVPDAGKTACARACKAMAKAYGVKVGYMDDSRIQVATAEDKEGRVSTTPDRTAKARDYIDSELRAGRPVTVGVSMADNAYNRDKITDHFVLITGRGTDEQGRTYYTYHDPGTNYASRGANNRFYVDPNSGNLVHEGPTKAFHDRHSELSTVLRNVG